MKSWVDMRSPWGKQLRFDDVEFEAMMEEMRARTGSDCFTSGRGIDVDRILLKGLGVEADYTDLPPNVLGRTKFDPDGRVSIEISRELAERAEIDNVARRRLRTTLAHECGHAACHACLFVRDTETYSLFAEQPTLSQPNRPPIMCRSEGVASGYRGEWWEYQANRCMAALLMPKRLVSNSVKERLTVSGFASASDCVAEGHGESFIRGISDEYDVSQVATLYRLQDLGFIPKGVQREMNLLEL